MGKLTALDVKHEAKPGRHADGQGLHLHVRANRLKTWVFRHTRAGKQRNMSLSSYPDVTLADARNVAYAARRVSRGGVDPIEARRLERNRTATGRTFKDVADDVAKAQSNSWSANHTEQMRYILQNYASR